MAFSPRRSPQPLEKLHSPHLPIPIASRPRSAHDLPSLGPMPIPSLKGASPPPPLPPPRQIEGLDQGQDPGWHFANRRGDKEDTTGGLGSVKAGSSLLGGARSSFGKQYPVLQKPVDLKGPGSSPSASLASVGEHHVEGRVPDLAALLEFK